MKSKPVLRDVLRVDLRWAGYLPPSRGRNNRVIDMKRGRRRVRRLQPL